MFGLGPEEVDVRMDMAKADGTAGYDRIEVRGPHRGADKPALASSIESWSTMRAMNSGSRMMIIENSFAGSSKSNGIVERAIQSAQGMIRTIRSAIEEMWEGEDRRDTLCVAVDRPTRIFLSTRFKVGSDGQTAYERLKGKSAKLPGLPLAEGILLKRRRAKRPHGKLTCTWEDGVYFLFWASKCNHGTSHHGEPGNGVWLTRTVRRKTARER